MNHKHFGGTAIVLGVVVQIAEGISHADAVLNNVPYEQTSIGAITTPVEKYLPFDLGWSLIILGAGILVIGAVL